MSNKKNKKGHAPVPNASDLDVDVPPTEPAAFAVESEESPSAMAEPFGSGTFDHDGPLAADIGAGAPGVVQTRAYWLGAYPTCTGEGLAIGGQDFPKLTEEVRPSRGIGGTSQRIPHVGKVIHLAESQVRKIEEKMPLRVIRFLEPPADHQQRDAFDEEPRRKGYAIRIPTDADMASARASGRGLPGYVRQKWDEPAARYLFMELCADQANPARSGAYPPPLSEHQGSLWPDD